MLIEGVVRANGESVSHPVVLAPIVENLVRNKTGELSFPNGKRMLDLTASAIAPGIDLRVAPAALEPVTLEGEFAGRKSQSRVRSQPIFILPLAVRWASFAVKIEWIETQVLVGFDYPTDSPALINYGAEITANSNRALKHEVDFLAHRYRQLLNLYDRQWRFG